MQNTTFLHADHALDQLAGQFAHWRQTRPHPSGRIPQPLWDQAVTLATTLPPSRVAKQLRLRLGDLKKQMERRATTPVAGASGPLGFVEVPLTPSLPQPVAAIHIELARADGTRLCLHSSEASLPLAAVVRAFLEGHSWSNSARKAGSLSRPNRWIFAKGLMGSQRCAGAP